ncbi:MAG: proprotein convertase P-domain-containing protein, partial [Bacteroidetes bacterium]|nr:proprotein convertase P-domain-containing protein [Bacteroidota bacterium]
MRHCYKHKKKTGTHWGGFVFLFLTVCFGTGSPSGGFAQTAVGDPSGTAQTYTGTYSSGGTLNGRDIGISTGVTYNFTNASWPAHSFWGVPVTCGAVDGNYAAAPNDAACSATYNLTFNAGASNLANGVAVFTGTTNYKYMDATWTYVTAPALDAKLTMTVTTTGGSPIRLFDVNNSGTEVIACRANQNFKARMLIEVKAPASAAWINVHTGGTYTPALTLFDDLHTDPAKCICTRFQESFYSIPEATVTALSVASCYNDIAKTLVITGTNLSGATDVKVGGSGGTSLTSFTVNSPTQITATVQAGICPISDGQVAVETIYDWTADNAQDNFTVNERHIIPVDDGGGTDVHTTIQGALNGLWASINCSGGGATALSNPKVIDVYSGTYAEKAEPNTLINPTAANRLIIKAAVNNYPVINAGGQTNGIKINAIDNVFVGGFSVFGSTNDVIYLKGANIECSNNRAYNSSAGAGIKLDGCTSANVHNCLIYNNYTHGIHNISSNSTTYENNTVYSNGYSSGGGSSTITPSSGAISVAINDGTCDVNFATHSINVGSSVTITDVNVTVNLNHTYDGDIKIYLQSPATTTVLLSNRYGGGGDNYTSTTFDDEAGTAISAGTAPFTGSYRPESVLSAFDGQNSSGNWTIKVTDCAGGDVGTITSWSMVISYSIPPTYTGSGLYIQSGTGALLKNNIFVAKNSAGGGYLAMSTAAGITISTSSAYNTYYSNGNANFITHNSVNYSVIGTWNGTAYGNNDLASDPQFVTAGSDFHLKSTQTSYHGGSWPAWDDVGGAWTTDGSGSLSIDAGDPASAYAEELPCNGNRINQGCYGNTPQASKTIAIPKPVLNTTINITASGARIRWNAVGGAVAYYIMVSENSDMSSPFISDLNVGTALFYDLSGLDDYTNYYFAVKVQTASCIGEYCDPGTFMTIVAPPVLTNVPSVTVYKDRGKTILITGSHFVTPGVTLGGVSGTVNSSDWNNINVTFPPGNYANNTVTVTTAGGSVNNSTSITVATRDLIPVKAGSSNEDDHLTINSAVDGLWAWWGSAAFTSNKIIYVFAGTYAESVNINKNFNPSPFRLRFEAASGRPILDAASNTYGFYINDADGAINNVTISGFEVKNASGDGIKFVGANDSIINNVVHNCNNYNILHYGGGGS